MKRLDLRRGRSVALPAFFPDGTYGAVKAVDAADLREAGIGGVVMNALHLSQKPGANLVKRMGGLHAFTGFDRPILTDSGGFQVFSLIRENPRYGRVRAGEVLFYPGMGDQKYIYSPQKCVRNQFALGSDIIMCLDYCTHPNDPPEIQRQSVDTTVRWAALCKREYELQCKNLHLAPEDRPLLFGIIQGGNDRELRARCARALIEIGFDGFGFGGWPLDDQGNLVDDILAYTASLMPDHLVKYAMGLGRPEEIVRCARMGYDLFDCVIPTREARRHRLYVFTKQDVTEPDFYRFLYIMDDTHAADSAPVSKDCDCHCCRHHSRAYLRHLFRLDDAQAYRLATIHNLRFYAMLMERIRGTGN
ncbi:MAG: queuine tRNA-ribosyltransferase family protein [Clostridia bacterium]|nr:queuine tRNA-ribosyltransferase family protein [Clostridia bacterium]